MRNSTLNYLLFIIAITHSTTSKGQQIKLSHEFILGYGAPSIIELTEGVYSGEDGYNSRPVNAYSGTGSFTYRCYIFPWFAVGVGGAYENETGGIRVRTGYSGYQATTSLVGSFKRNVYSIAPEVLFCYSKIKKKYREKYKKVSTYGYVSYGQSYVNELDVYNEAYYNSQFYNGKNYLGGNREMLDNKKELTFQFCPIGFAFGGKLSGFFELGVGYKGIINTGISVKL